MKNIFANEREKKEKWFWPSPCYYTYANGIKKKNTKRNQKERVQRKTNERKRIDGCVDVCMLGSG